MVNANDVSINVLGESVSRLREMFKDRKGVTFSEEKASFLWVQKRLHSFGKVNDDSGNYTNTATEDVSVVWRGKAFGFELSSFDINEVFKCLDEIEAEREKAMALIGRLGSNELDYLHERRSTIAGNNYSVGFLTELSKGLHSMSKLRFDFRELEIILRWMGD